VVYHNGYRDDSGIQFLIKAGIDVMHIPVLEE
jgi:dCMP deaminase